MNPESCLCNCCDKWEDAFDELKSQNEILFKIKADLHRRLNNCRLIAEASDKEKLDVIDRMHEEIENLKKQLEAT